MVTILSSWLIVQEKSLVRNGHLFGPPGEWVLAGPKRISSSPTMCRCSSCRLVGCPQVESQVFVAHSQCTAWAVDFDTLQWDSGPRGCTPSLKKDRCLTHTQMEVRIFLAYSHVSSSLHKHPNAHAYSPFHVFAHLRTLSPSSTLLSL